jgi:hypothetical protein
MPYRIFVNVPSKVLVDAKLLPHHAAVVVVASRTVVPIYGQAHRNNWKIFFVNYH